MQNIKKKKTVTNQEKIDRILSKSDNITIVKKEGSTFFLRCNNCDTDFNVIGYYNRTKFICPTCKKKKNAERKKELRQLRKQGVDTTIKRKCKNLERCLITGEYLCQPCTVFEKPYISKKEFKESIENNNDITIVSEYVDSKTRIEFVCNKCGNKSSARPYNLFNGLAGCKICGLSIGARKIASVLEKLNVGFCNEKIFKDCKYISPLRFDFYLYDYNAIIEYDGRQHFSPVAFGKNADPQEEYENLKKRDDMKNDYCKKHKIPMLRVRYDDENIEKTVRDFVDSIHI